MRNVLYLVLGTSMLFTAGCGNGYNDDEPIDGATNCSIYRMDNGDTLMTCADGSETIIQGGLDGLSGEQGSSCTATATDDGVSLQCPGQDPIVIKNGQDGANADNCAVFPGESGMQLECPGQEPVVIQGLPGPTGTSCNIVSHQGGLQISCGDDDVQYVILSQAICAVQKEDNDGLAITCNGETHHIDRDCSNGFPFDLIVSLGNVSQPSYGQAEISLLPIFEMTSCTTLRGMLDVYTNWWMWEGEERPETLWPASLSRITAIEGDFYVDGGGDFLIQMPELETVGGDFTIYNGGENNTLGNFGKLSHVGGNFEISGTTLTDLTDFDALSTIDSVTIRYNAELSQCVIDDWLISLGFEEAGPGQGNNDACYM